MTFASQPHTLAAFQRHAHSRLNNHMRMPAPLTSQLPITALGSPSVSFKLAARAPLRFSSLRALPRPLPRPRPAAAGAWAARVASITVLEYPGIGSDSYPGIDNLSVDLLPRVHVLNLSDLQICCSQTHACARARARALLSALALQLRAQVRLPGPHCGPQVCAPKV